MNMTGKLWYGLTEDELVLEDLAMQELEEEALRPRWILEKLIDLEPLPGATSRVCFMAMKLFEKQSRRAASVGASYQDIRSGQNDDQLLLACLYTALIWETG